jgi:hypothetical protein
MVPFIPMDFSRVSGRKQRFLLVVWVGLKRSESFVAQACL